MEEQESVSRAGGVALFFVTYMLVVSTVLVNIVIAVLLDEFMNTMSETKVCVCLSERSSE